MSIDAGVWQAGRSRGAVTAPRADGSLVRRVAAALARSRGRLRPRDVVAMMRHLATLLTAGLRLSKALRTVARQMRDTGISQVVSQLAEEVEAGETFSTAMSRHREIFEPLMVHVVRAGEAGGTLSETLGRLADELEQKQAVRRAVAGAMVYPAIVLSIAALVVGFVLLFVVPTFQDVYTKMKLELPWITRLLLFTSRLVVGWWWALALGVPGAVVALRRLKQRPAFRQAWDGWMLRVPVFGELRRKATAARFFGAFGTLIGSGVPIAESLRLLVHLADNRVVEEALQALHHSVSHGGRLSAPMERYTGLFSPMATQMVCVGEETGSLPEASARTAELLTQDVHLRVKTLITLLEPLLTVALGAVVGTIALAIYLPMFDLMKHVSQ